MGIIPKRIWKEIKRANKKANRLRRKLGLKNAKSKCTKDSLYEIEVKVPYEDYKNGKIPSSLEDCNEYAYFYTRDDLYFGAEKIKNGKLKEYYETLNPNNFIAIENEGDNCFSDHYVSYNNIMSSNRDSIINTLNGMIKNKEYQFKINGKKYYANYYSITPKNEIDQIYFYEIKYSKGCRDFLYDFDGKYGREILRYSFKENRIDKVYFETKDKDNLIFYYTNPNENWTCNEVLVSLHFQVLYK